MAISLILVGLIIVTWVICRYRRMTLLSRRGFPGPRPHFLFGNMFEIEANGGAGATYQKWHKQYGPIVGFYVGGVPSLVVADPNLLTKVMITDFATFNMHQTIIKGGSNAVGPPADNIVLTRSVDYWRRLRTTVTPAFTSAQLRHMIPPISAIIDTFVDKLRPLADCEEIAIAEHINRTTLGVISRVAFGLDLGYASSSAKTLHQADQMADALTKTVRVSLNEITCGKLMLLFPEFTFIWWPIRLLIDHVLFLFSLTPESKMLDIARKALNTRKNAKSTVVGSSQRRDLMQILMEARQRLDHQFKDSDFEMNTSEAKVVKPNPIGQPSIVTNRIALNDDEVLSLIYVVVGAGYETTAAALQYLMYNLANHQVIQEQLRQEIAKIKVDDDGIFEYESLMFDSPLMEAVIRETLRLYPPVSQLVHRVADVDYHYEDRTIPAGVGIVSSVVPMHLSESYWPDPLTWNPFRHLTPDGQKLVAPPSPFAYQPFGNGPRNCVGMRLAYLEMNLALAKLLKKFRIVPGPSTQTGRLQTREEYITLSPANPIYVKMELL